MVKTVRFRTRWRRPTSPGSSEEPSYKAMNDLLQYVPVNYLEVDIDELNETAWKEYVQFHKDFANSTS